MTALEVYIHQGKSQLVNQDAMTAYSDWPTPTVIISDGAYGLGVGDWDTKTANKLAEWYRPHILQWTARAIPETTLWLWNTEIGWATIHPVLKENGWIYRGCNIWNKGKGHMAGNVNSKTIRKFPIVTEVCAQYTRSGIQTLGGDAVDLRDWLRDEWKRSGLKFSAANTACGVKNAATRKYLTGDDAWYFPPPPQFDALVAYANLHGLGDGKPYFSKDGIVPLRGSQWVKQRAKFICPFGVSNVWDEPSVRGLERLKINGKMLHPNQKPIALIKMLIECSSNCGDVVWEPFAGTAPALVACLRSERLGYGAEINSIYFDAAQKRISSNTKKEEAYPVGRTRSLNELFETPCGNDVSVKAG